MKWYYLLLLCPWLMLFSCQDDPVNDFEKSSISSDLAEQALKTSLGEYFYDLNIDNLAKSDRANKVIRTLKIHRSKGFFSIKESEDCAPYLQVVIEGNGNATFLGNFNVVNTYCFDGTAPTSPIRGILTAANGDQIFTIVTYAEEYDPPEESYLHYEVEGGTGRFEGITGYIDMYGIIDRTAFTFDLYGTGEIAF